jgi:NAD(P)-dependent dehydrogenase (short-subunit alcohol dehydrogenase family)
MTGRAVLVTGASRGIGAAVAHAFAARGDRVAVHHGTSPERAERVVVSAVAPGLTETDMAAEALAGDRGEARRAESPLGRVATPEDVAAAVVYLASEEAAMASGSVIDVNGASYLRM